MKATVLMRLNDGLKRGYGKLVSRPSFLMLSCAAILSVAVSGTGFAQTVSQAQPDTENGRYALSAIDGGFARLDKTTGQISTCKQKSGGDWACYVAPDERAALDAEIGRLSQENARLKAALAASAGPGGGKIDEALPKSDSLRRDGDKAAKSENKIEIPLPSEADMQKAMTFLEKVWRQLAEMAARIQKDVSGGI